MHQTDFKIYILSENLPYRNNLATKLRLEGYNVEFATGGFHFLHILERFGNFMNLIICHDNMHDMPAEEIIQITRLLKTKSELPILYISKDNEEELVCEMILCGANEFVLQSNNMLPVIERVRKTFATSSKALKAS